MAKNIPVVLVTGASRGIGREIAVYLSRLGFSVAINYNNNIDAADETLNLCMNSRINEYQRFVPIKANIGIKQERTKLVDSVLEEFGRIDALINNAGVGPKERKDITGTTEASFKEVIGINLEGPFFLTQQVANYWLNRKPELLLPSGFKIIFISSISAETVSVNRAEYCIAKAGISMLNKLWAVRLADEGVQVYELRPGIMFTDMTKNVKEKYDKLIENGIVPQKRWGSPNDVALAVGSLLKGEFPFSTGESIYIDGGFHITNL